MILKVQRAAIIGGTPGIGLAVAGPASKLGWRSPSPHAGKGSVHAASAELRPGAAGKTADVHDPPRWHDRAFAIGPGRPDRSFGADLR